MEVVEEPVAAVQLPKLEPDEDAASPKGKGVHPGRARGRLTDLRRTVVSTIVPGFTVAVVPRTPRQDT
jgi:hypothetical protein